MYNFKNSKAIKAIRGALVGVLIVLLAVAAILMAPLSSATEVQTASAATSYDSISVAWDTSVDTNIYPQTSLYDLKNKLIVTGTTTSGSSTTSEVLSYDDYQITIITDLNSDGVTSSAQSSDKDVTPFAVDDAITGITITAKGTSGGDITCTLDIDEDGAIILDANGDELAVTQPYTLTSFSWELASDATVAVDTSFENFKSLIVITYEGTDADGSTVSGTWSASKNPIAPELLSISLTNNPSATDFAGLSGVSTSVTVTYVPGDSVTALNTVTPSDVAIDSISVSVNSEIVTSYRLTESYADYLETSFEAYVTAGASGEFSSYLSSNTYDTYLLGGDANTSTAASDYYAFSSGTSSAFLQDRIIITITTTGGVETPYTYSELLSAYDGISDFSASVSSNKVTVSFDYNMDTYDGSLSLSSANCPSKQSVAYITATYTGSSTIYPYSSIEYTDVNVYALYDDGTNYSGQLQYASWNYTATLDTLFSSESTYSSSITVTLDDNSDVYCTAKNAVSVTNVKWVSIEWNSLRLDNKYQQINTAFDASGMVVRIKYSNKYYIEITLDKETIVTYKDYITITYYSDKDGEEALSDCTTLTSSVQSVSVVFSIPSTVLYDCNEPLATLVEDGLFVLDASDGFYIMPEYLYPSFDLTTTREFKPSGNEFELGFSWFISDAMEVAAVYKDGTALTLTTETGTPASTEYKVSGNVITVYGGGTYYVVVKIKSDYASLYQFIGDGSTGTASKSDGASYNDTITSGTFKIDLQTPPSPKVTATDYVYNDVNEDSFSAPVGVTMTREAADGSEETALAFGSVGSANSMGYTTLILTFTGTLTSGTVSTTRMKFSWNSTSLTWEVVTESGYSTTYPNAAGSYSVRANMSGSSDYKDATTVTRATFDIARLQISANNGSVVYDAAEHDAFTDDNGITFTAGNGVNKNNVITATDVYSYVSSTSSTKITNVGTITFTLSLAEGMSDNYVLNNTTVTFSVTQFENSAVSGTMSSVTYSDSDNGAAVPSTYKTNIPGLYSGSLDADDMATLTSGTGTVTVRFYTAEIFGNNVANTDSPTTAELKSLWSSVSASNYYTIDGSNSSKDIKTADAGSYYAVFFIAGTTNYVAAYGYSAFTINKAQIALPQLTYSNTTINPNGTITLNYTDSSYEITASGNPAGGISDIYSTYLSIVPSDTTNVSVSDNTITVKKANENGYTITISIASSLLANYCWYGDETNPNAEGYAESEGKTFTIVINKAVLSDIVFSDNSLTSLSAIFAYKSGSAALQSKSISNFNSTLMTIDISGVGTKGTDYKVDDSSGTVSFTNAGDYTITITLTDEAAANYKFTTNSTVIYQTLTISVARLGVSIPYAKTVTYNGETQEAGLYTSSSYDTLDSWSGIAYVASNNTGKDAGSYSITLTLTDNYKWSSGYDASNTEAHTITWVIEKIKVATPTYSWSSKTYTGSSQTFEFDSSTWNKSQSAESTYADMVNSLTALSIKEVALILPSGTSTTLSSVNGTSSGSTIYVTYAGKYTITVTLASVTNYEWYDGTEGTTKTFTSAITIQQKSIAIEWSSTADVTYDGNPHTLTASVATANGNYNGVSFTVDLSVEGINVGEYTATASFATDETTSEYSFNYTLTNTTATFKIVQRVLTVAWDNLTTTYSGSAQLPTATAGNVVDGENITFVLKAEPQSGYSLSGSDAIDAGLYTISIDSISGTTASNYTLENTESETSKTFTIKKVIIGEASLNAYTATYNGSSQNDVIYVQFSSTDADVYEYSSISGVITITPSGTTFAGGSVSTTPTTSGAYIVFTNAGSYTVTVSINSGNLKNYCWCGEVETPGEDGYGTYTDASLTFTVEKQTVGAATIGTTSLIYTGSAQEFAVTYNSVGSVTAYDSDIINITFNGALTFENTSATSNSYYVGDGTNSTKKGSVYLTNAGNYVVSISLKNTDDYCWSNDNLSTSSTASSATEITLTMRKRQVATPSIENYGDTKTFTNGSQTFNVVFNSDNGDVYTTNSVTDGDSNMVSITAAGTYYNDISISLSGYLSGKTLTFTEAGIYKITVTLLDTANYCWEGDESDSSGYSYSTTAARTGTGATTGDSETSGYNLTSASSNDVLTVVINRVTVSAPYLGQDRAIEYVAGTIKYPLMTTVTSGDSTTAMVSGDWTISYTLVASNVTGDTYARGSYTITLTFTDLSAHLNYVWASNESTTTDGSAANQTEKYLIEQYKLNADDISGTAGTIVISFIIRAGTYTVTVSIGSGSDGVEYTYGTQNDDYVTSSSSWPISVDEGDSEDDKSNAFSSAGITVTATYQYKNGDSWVDISSSKSNTALLYKDKPYQAGTYRLMLVYDASENDDYETLTFYSNTFVINPLAITVEWAYESDQSSYSYVYDGITHSVSVSITNQVSTYDDSVIISFTLSATDGSLSDGYALNVGTYLATINTDSTISGKGATNSVTHAYNYTITGSTNLTQTFTITQRTVTIIAGTGSRVYGTDLTEGYNLSAVTYADNNAYEFILSSVSGQDEPTLAGFTQAVYDGENTIVQYTKVGTTYKVCIVEQTWGNYTITYNYVETYAITAATMSVTAIGYNSAYDGYSHNVVPSVTLVNTDDNDSIKIYYSTTYSDCSDESTTTISYTNVGTYTVYYKVVADNHTTVTSSFNITISKAKLTVSASGSYSVYYGETFDTTLSSLAYTLSGFVIDNDTQANLLGLSGSVTYATVYTAGNGIGTGYTITLSSSTLTSTNYSIEISNASYASLEVVARPVTVTIATKSSVYGNESVILTYSVADGITGNSLTGSYALSTIKSELNDKISLDVDGAVTRKTASVGHYAILGGNTNNNYDVTFSGEYSGDNEKGDYEVTARPITVQISTASSIYGDALDLASLVTIGLKNGSTLADCDSEYASVVYGYQIQTSGGTVINRTYDADDYQIVGLSNLSKSSNYTITFEYQSEDGSSYSSAGNQYSVYTITKRGVAITAANKSSTYGETMSTSLSWSYTNGDDNSYQFISSLSSDSVSYLVVNGAIYDKLTDSSAQTVKYATTANQSSDVLTNDYYIIYLALSGATATTASYTTNQKYNSLEGTVTYTITLNNYTVTVTVGKHTIEQRQVTIDVSSLTTTFGDYLDTTDSDLLNVSETKEGKLYWTYASGSNKFLTPSESGTVSEINASTNAIYDTLSDLTYGSKAITFYTTAKQSSNVTDAGYILYLAIGGTSTTYSSEDAYESGTSYTITLNNYEVTVNVGNHTISRRDVYIAMGDNLTTDGTVYGEKVTSTISWSYSGTRTQQFISEVNESGSITYFKDYATSGTISISDTIGSNSVTISTATTADQGQSVAYYINFLTIGDGYKTTLPSGYTSAKGSNWSDDWDTTRGTYTITMGNYSVTVTYGKYQITPREITVKIEDLTSVYGANVTYAYDTSEGQIKVVENTNTTATVTGGSVYDTNDSLEDLITLWVDSTVTSHTANAGEYEITGKSATQNYKITFIGSHNESYDGACDGESGTYTVTKATLVITPDSDSVVYGEDFTASKYIVSGWQNSDGNDGTVTATEGTKTVTEGIAEITYGNGLTVGLKAASTSGTVYSAGNAATENGGSYVITIVSAEATDSAGNIANNYYIVCDSTSAGKDPNSSASYSDDSFSATLTVNQRAVTIEFDSKTLYYNLNVSYTEGNRQTFAYNGNDDGVSYGYTWTITSSNGSTNAFFSGDNWYDLFTIDCEAIATWNGSNYTKTAATTADVKYNSDYSEILTYTISLSQVGNKNYDIGCVEATFTINPAQLVVNIVLDQKDLVYDGAAKTYTGTAEGNTGTTFTPTYYKGSSAIAANILKSAPTEVGDYYVLFSADNNKNYQAAIAGQTFAITPKELTVSFSYTYDDGSEDGIAISSKTTAAYSGYALVAKATFGENEVVSGDVVNVSYTYSSSDVTVTNNKAIYVGTYTIEISIDNENYSLHTESTSFEITKASVTIAEFDSIGGYTATDLYQGTSLEFVIVNYNTGTNPGKNNADILNAVLNASDDLLLSDDYYKATAADSTLTISVYNAGTYTITVSLADTDNYQWYGGSMSARPYTIKISQATLNLNVASQSITYGDKLDTSNYTFSYDGWQGDDATKGVDTIVVGTESTKQVTGTVTYYIVKDTYSTKSAYNSTHSISVKIYTDDDEGLSSTNYELVVNPGTLTVEKREITVTINDYTSTYNGTNQTSTMQSDVLANLSMYFSGDKFATNNSEGLSDLGIKFSNTSSDCTNAGDYSFALGYENTNYSVTWKNAATNNFEFVVTSNYKEGSEYLWFHIQKAVLTATVSSESVVYGATADAVLVGFSVTYAGFADDQYSQDYGKDETKLGQGTPSYTTSLNGNGSVYTQWVSAAGETYTVYYTAYTFANYTVSVKTTTFTISPMTVSLKYVTSDGYESTFTSSDHSSTGDSNPVTIAFSYTGNTPDGSYVPTYTITYSATSINDGTTANFTTGTNAPTQAGTYSISVGLTSGNYLFTGGLTSSMATYVINKQTLETSWDNGKPSLSTDENGNTGTTMNTLSNYWSEVMTFSSSDFIAAGSAAVAGESQSHGYYSIDTTDGKITLYLNVAGDYSITLTLIDTANYEWSSPNADAEKTTLTFTAIVGSTKFTIEISSWTYGESANSYTVTDANFSTEYAGYDVYYYTGTASDFKSAYEEKAKLSFTEGDVLSSSVISALGMTQTVPSEAAKYVIYVVYKGSETTASSSAIAEFEISAQTITITGFAILGWTYGENANSPTYSSIASNVTNYNTATIALTYIYAVKDGDTLDGVPSDAGNYTVTVSIVSSNFELAYTYSAEFTIGKATLTVTAGDNTVTYGEGYLSNESYTITGFVKGESESDLSGSVSLNADNYSEGSDAGTTYSIVANGLSSNNYTFNYVDGTLTVVPRAITVNITGTLTSVYGESIATLYLALAEGSSVYNSQKPYDTDIATAVTSSSDAGSYLIKLSTDGNYTITYKHDGEEVTSLTYLITKATLYVFANDGSVTYGEAYTHPTDGYMIKNASGATVETNDIDGFNGFDGNVTYATSYVAGTTPYNSTAYANYITISLSTLSSTNYYIVIGTDSDGSQTGGASLTVNQRTIAVSITADGGTYNGEAYAATATATTYNSGSDTGAVKGDTIVFVYTYSGTLCNYTSYSETTTAPTQAGSYTVTISLDSTDTDYATANYVLDGTLSATFTISPVKLGKPYLTGDGSTYELTYNFAEQSVESAVFGFDKDLMAYVGQGAGADIMLTKTDVGEYTVIIRLVDSNNYVWDDSTTSNVSLNWAIVAISGDTGSGTASAAISFTVSFDGYSTYGDLNSDSTPIGLNFTLIINGYDATDDIDEDNITFYYYGESYNETWKHESTNMTTSCPTQAGDYYVVVVLNGVEGSYSTQTSDACEFYIYGFEIYLSVTVSSGVYSGDQFKASVEPSEVATVDGKVDSLDEAYSILYTGTLSNGTSYSSSDAPTDAGSYTVTVTLNDNVSISKNYYLSAESYTASFTISKASITKPTADGTTFTYDGSEQTYQLAINSAYTISNNTMKINAGTYEITVTLVSTNNYQWNDGSVSDLTYEFVINKAEITITVTDGQTITYGDEFVSSNFKYTTDGYKLETENASNVIIGGIVLTATGYSVTSAAGSTYTLTASTSELEADNYTFRFVDSELTVKRREITTISVIVNNNETITYGDDLVVTATPQNVVNNDSLVYVLTYVSTDDGTYSAVDVAPTAAGSYKVTVTLCSIDTTTLNYTINSAVYTAEFTIKKATLTVTANAGSITYGDKFAPSNYSYTISGFMYNDDSSVLTITPETTAVLSVVDYSAGTTVGSTCYIKVIVDDFEADNYNFVPGTNAMLTVEKRDISLSVTATNAYYTADAYDYYNLVGITPTNVYNNETLGYIYTYVGTANDATDWNATTAPSKAGVYTVTITLNEATAKNYNLTNSAYASFNINRATITLTTDSTTTVTYDTKDHTLVINGYVGAALSFGTSGSANDGTSVSDAVANDGTVTLTETMAGTYIVTFTITDKANYTLMNAVNDSVSFTLTIERAPVTSPSTNSDLSVTYDTKDHMLVVNYDSSVVKYEYDGNSESVETGEGTVTATEKNAGSYTLTFSIDTNNYVWEDGATTSFTLVIGKATIEISNFADVTTTFNESYSAETATATFHLEVTYNYVGTSYKEGAYSSSKAPTLAGTYTVTATVTTDGTNYETVTKEITLIISKKDVALPTITGNELIYNGETQSATVSGYDSETMTLSTTEYVVDGETITLSGKNADNYSVTISLRDADNYEWSNNGVDTTYTLTIAKLAITISLTAEDSVYGSVTDPVIEISSELVSVDKNNLTIVYAGDSNDGSYVTGTSYTVAPKVAGSYTITITLTDTGNFTLTDGTTEYTVAKAFTISQKEVTVTANNATIAYGESYEFTSENYTVDGFIVGEEFSTVVLNDGEVTLVATSYTNKSSAGNTYTITASGSGLTAHNYYFTYVDATLKVTVRTISLEISVNEDKTITYGDAVSTVLTPTNVVSGDTVSYVYTYEGTANDGESWNNTTAPTKAGEYKVTITLNVDDSITKNYVLAEEYYMFFTIERATVTLSGSSDTQTYSGSAYAINVEGYVAAALNYATSGVGNDKTSSATASDDGSVVTMSAIAAGEYTLTITLTDGDNYVLADGCVTTYTLTINRAKVTALTFTADNATYDGETHTLVISGFDSATTAYKHESSTDSESIIVEDGTVTVSVLEADTYTITFTIIDTANYEWETNSDTEFTITITANTVTVETTTGSVISSITVNSENELVSSFKLDMTDWTYSDHSAEDIANYISTLLLNALLDSSNNAIFNYEGTTVTYLYYGESYNGEWVYTETTAVKTAPSLAGEYYVKVVVTNDSILFSESSSGSQTQAMSLITPLAETNGTTTSNTLTLTSSFVIAKKEVSVTSSDVTGTYSGSMYSVTVNGYDSVAMEYSVTGTAYSGTNATVIVTSGGIVVLATEAGSYAISFSLADAYNYSLTGTDSFKLTINKAQVTAPTADTTTYTYNGAAQTYTLVSSSLYTISGNTQTKAGEYTVTVALNNANNYEWSNGSTETLSYTYVIEKSNANLSGTASLEGWSIGEDANLPEGVTSTEGTVVYVYSTEIDGEYTTEQPTEAGTYYVKAYVAETDNFNAVYSEAVSFEIQTITNYELLIIAAGGIVIAICLAVVVSQLVKRRKLY